MNKKNFIKVKLNQNIEVLINYIIFLLIIASYLKKKTEIALLFIKKFKILI